MPVAAKLARWLATVAVTVVLTVTLVTAIADRRMADLGPEHRLGLDQEFTAAAEQSTNWNDYLLIEAALSDELRQEIDADGTRFSQVDRYWSGGLTNPDNFDTNWNLSYQLDASPARGVALLLHGLSDSPYSMRATAETLQESGYNVVVPRMPGHGFAVGSLLDTRWEDWAAAVRVAVRHAAQLPGAEQSFIIAGYSNGGLMAIDFALRCDDDPELPCPDGLVLFSPAIAVSSLAVISNWHTLLSWIPYFEKSKWLSILPEVDPFKFTSFPKRAAWEIYRLSTGTYKQLKQPAEAARLPPILTFQSVVDNTVSTSAIITNLYNRLPANGSDLVIYDVNRDSSLLHLMKTIPADPVTLLQAGEPLSFGVTVLRNRTQDDKAIDIYSFAAGELQPEIKPTGMAWPQGIYSMSHIAVPFRPNDPVYGDGSGADDIDQGITFGTLAPRGEEGVMRLNSAYFLRTRYNPFFSYQAQHLRDWLDELDQSAESIR